MLYKVCIDPGHGGFDPGAVGPQGTKEKDVTLAIGLKVKELLESNGIAVVMTRLGDYAPGRASDVNADLKNRAAIANSSNADVFVSIHINSAPVRAASGCECYIYRRGGAAEKLALAVHKSIVAETGLADRGVKTANFYVIRETKMPAVLGETGFISNPIEELKLRDPQFQVKIAKGYTRGICQYFGLPFREGKPLGGEFEVEYGVVVNTYADFPAAEPVAVKYQAPLFLMSALKEAGKCKTLIVCGGDANVVKKVAPTARVIDLSGEDRFETYSKIKEFLQRGG